ncbi:hypothetical protein ES702_06871 [subsurface metagenome]
MRKEFPFYYKLFKKNKVRDFLILLNVPLTSEDSKKEKIKTLVHETIHYIQHANEMITDFESIQKEADRIVDEFQILCEKKMIEKHGNAD